MGEELFQSSHVSRRDYTVSFLLTIRLTFDNEFPMQRVDFTDIQDADYEYDVDEIPGLLAPLLEGKAGVVYGSRFKKTN